jgi:predicted ATP-grasp superfamily ATP-dependent carboligase
LEFESRFSRMCKGEANNTVQPAAVVVDPYSSGKFLLEDLAAQQVPIIAVRSTRMMSNQFLKSHDANKHFFTQFFEFDEMDGELSVLVRALDSLPYQVSAVFAGCEPGVELANKLSHELRLPTTNPLGLLSARTDKAEMQEALRRNGVPAAKQFKSGDLQELQAWARSNKEWPLVAKPVGGAGSEGVFFCKNEQDLEAAHKHIIGNRSSTGAMNHQLALQEFLAGDEYIVDTVSHNGKHMCIAIWVYKKVRGLPWNPHAIMVQQSELLEPVGAEQDALVDYVFNVLDAVGLQHGPCHTEVMFTKRGPILVEVNARMHGLLGPRLIELSTGTSKARYTTDVLLNDGSMFNELYKSGPGRYAYPLLRNCIQLSLISPVEGYLEVSLKDEIMAMGLESVTEVVPAVQKGQYLQKTKDLPTTPGTVLMVHESKEQLEADIAQIRQAEASLTFYTVVKGQQ